MRLKISSIYLLCTGVILVGFVMLVQPFSMAIFSWGLPVLVAGSLVHIVLDHLPAGLAERFDDRFSARKEDR